MTSEGEAGAVERVAARFRDGVDRGARVDTVPGGPYAVFELEFLERVRKRHRLADVVQGIVVVAAIDEIERAVAGAARDRNRDGARILPLAPDERARAAVVDRRARQEDQLRRLAAVERQP